MRQIFDLKESCGDKINNNLQLPLLHFYRYASVPMWNLFDVLLMLYLQCTVRAVIFTFIYIFKTLISQIYQAHIQN
jgi:hypothetical protein